jgi:hypothetical protein
LSISVMRRSGGVAGSVTRRSGSADGAGTGALGVVGWSLMRFAGR